MAHSPFSQRKLKTLKIFKFYIYRIKNLQKFLNSLEILSNLVELSLAGGQLEKVPEYHFQIEKFKRTFVK